MSASFLRFVLTAVVLTAWVNHGWKSAAALAGVVGACWLVNKLAEAVRNRLGR